MVGSMDCINEFCFAANTCLMIDVHIYFNFTCPVISLLLFSVTLPPLLFMCISRNRSSWSSS